MPSSSAIDSRGSLDALDALHRRDDRVGLVGVGHDLDRRARVDQAVLDEELLAATDSTSWPAYVVSSLGMPEVSRRRAPRRDHGRIADVVTIQTARGRAGDPVAASAQKPDSVGSSLPKRGMNGQNTQRPQMTSSAGSRVTITTNVTATATALAGPRPAVELSSANIRQSRPTTTVEALAKIAGRGAVQRERHRLVPVLVSTQLLSISGDQQQRVVGAGADHEHGHDELRLPVDGHVGVLGQQVEHAHRDAEADDGAEDRQHPQHRAAVADQQDQDHRAAA